MAAVVFPEVGSEGLLVGMEMPHPQTHRERNWQSCWHLSLEICMFLTGNLSFASVGFAALQKRPVTRAQRTAQHITKEKKHSNQLSLLEQVHLTT